MKTLLLICIVFCVGCNSKPPASTSTPTPNQKVASLKDTTNQYLVHYTDSLLSAPAEKDTIDVELQKCLSKGEYKPRCFSIAIEAYEVEIDKNYRSLIKDYPASQKKFLIASQKAWEAYKKSEEALLNELNNHNRFAEDQLSFATQLHQIVKRRAFDLRNKL